MTTNYLYLNTNKITLIHITNNLFHFPTIYFENTALIPHNSTIYLGVTITNDLTLTLTQTLTMTAHINNITKKATYHLIQLCKIRKTLPSKTAYLLANALLFLYSTTILHYLLTQLNNNLNNLTV